MRLKLIVILLVCLGSATTAAMITYIPRPLRDFIEAAPVVAHVRITQIHDRQFQDGNRSQSCGRDYVVDVLTTFKGRPKVQRTFSVMGEPHDVLFHEVKPGDELLVLLTGRRKEDSPASWPSDVIGPAPSRAEIKCRRELSLMTLAHGHAGGFPLIMRTRTSDSGQKHTAWIAYSVARTEMPRSLLRESVNYRDHCSGLACTQPAYLMVPWEPLKAEIARWIREANQT